MQPLVSILIPAFNAEAWIEETLESAIAQTWPKKEIVVVDDGSRDQTLTIAKRYECGWIRVLTQENQGAAAARNAAYSMSQGDYIQWLDADDLLAEDKIEQQIKAVLLGRSRRTLFSGSWVRFLYRYHRAKCTPDALWCDLSPAEFLLRKLGQNLFMPNAAWLVSRELTEVAGRWDPLQTVDDDGEYFCRVVVASDGIQFVPQARMYYRSAGSNSVSNLDPSGAKLEAQWRTMRLHMQHLRSLEESEKTRSASVAFLQLNLVHFYPQRPDIVEQIESAAREMGARLSRPRLRWKYSWIAPLAGWATARRAQALLPRLRGQVARVWDRILLEIDPPPAQRGGQHLVRQSAPECPVGLGSGSNKE